MRFANALLALAACSATAWAQPAAPQVVPATAAPAASPVAPPPSRWSAAQLQQAFVAADADGNGQLSRAEAQQLIILPRSFEEMDANKDGALTRAEYESVARP